MLSRVNVIVLLVVTLLVVSVNSASVFSGLKYDEGFPGYRHPRAVACERRCNFSKNLSWAERCISECINPGSTSIFQLSESRFKFHLDDTAICKQYCKETIKGKGVEFCYKGCEEKYKQKKK
jgi:hypothetical protein